MEIVVSHTGVDFAHACTCVRRLEISRRRGLTITDFFNKM